LMVTTSVEKCGTTSYEWTGLVRFYLIPFVKFMAYGCPF